MTKKSDDEWKQIQQRQKDSELLLRLARENHNERTLH